nr:AraC family transcriptional regulator [uncultured Arsenicibacter sp.]
MKALFEKVSIADQESLLTKHVSVNRFNVPWHYHPEYELTYIVRSSGKRFVGDHVGDFVPGDLVLLGPNLPHFWRNDEDQPEFLTSEAYVIQFSPNLDNALFRTLPEADRIMQMLHRAKYGILFSEEFQQRIGRKMERLLTRSGMERIIDWLQILNELSYDTEAVLLASDSYQLTPNEAETERMKRVLEHMLHNFRKEIRIDEIASIAGMAPAAFCRYFRKRTNKSFVEYLNELRISHARKLLTQADMSVGQVGLECGFNNISHFHRQFRQQTGTTPLKYQTLYRDKEVPVLVEEEIY